MTAEDKDAQPSNSSTILPKTGPTKRKGQVATQETRRVSTRVSKPPGREINTLTSDKHSAADKYVILVLFLVPLLMFGSVPANANDPVGTSLR